MLTEPDNSWQNVLARTICGYFQNSVVIARE